MKHGDLIRAIANRDGAAIVFWLEAGGAPDWCDHRQQSLLHFACAFGDEGLFSALIARGARISVRNEDGLQPADMARLFGHMSLCDRATRLALQESDLVGFADLTLADLRAQAIGTGRNLLQELAAAGHFADFVNRMAARGERFTARDLLHETPPQGSVLLTVCRTGQLPVLLQPALWRDQIDVLAEVWAAVPASHRGAVDYPGLVATLRRDELRHESRRPSAAGRKPPKYF